MDGGLAIWYTQAMKNAPQTIDPNTLRTRDPLMVRIIQGVTKAAVHKDRKKDSDRKACRVRVQREEF